MNNAEAVRIHPLPGGIHPQPNKSRSAGRLDELAVPPRLVLPLQQHVGAPADPVVRVGDRVLAGEMLAKAHGLVSLPVHASTSGTVVAIGDQPVPHASGLPAPAIVLEADGLDRAIEPTPLRNWRERPAAELFAVIRNAGIAGLGGAGFPTALKLRGRPGAQVKTLVLNGAECEPSITADDTLMRHRASAIISGLRILAHLVAPERCLIGIEDDKPEAISAMREALAAVADDPDLPPTAVVSVPARYPSGGERQLVWILTGKEVPSGGLPLDIGVLCVNVASAWAIHRAVLDGRPLTKRITTITGDAVDNPGNLLLRLGTPAAFALDHCGWHPDRTARLVHGGPMMGFTLADANAPLVKISNCLIAGSSREFPAPEPELPCIRCGLCADACPAGLLPQQLFWHIRDGDLDAAADLHLPDCIECGACAVVCPSQIPLVHNYRWAKGELRIKAAEKARSDRARERFELRQQRLDQEAAEKEAKRQARMAKAKAKAAAKAKADASPDPAATGAGKP